MNQRFVLFLLSLLFVSGFVSAQLLWKVSGATLEKPSYLFATHHLIDKSEISGFHKVESLLSTVDLMMGEIDMTDITLLQTKVMQSAIMKDNHIKRLVSPENYLLLDSVFKADVGAGMDQLGMMKPMMLNSLFVVAMYMKDANLVVQPEAVDLHLQKYAISKGIPVKGIETIEQQLEVLFEKIPLNRQAEILIQSIQEKDKGLAFIRQTKAAFLVGDLAMLHQLSNDDNSMSDDEMKFLVDQRNLDWMTKMPTLFSEHSTFLAVGALHLVGETGIIHQLQLKGFTVQSIVIAE